MCRESALPQDTKGIKPDIKQCPDKTCIQIRISKSLQELNQSTSSLQAG